MHSEHTPSPLHRAPSANRLFGGLFLGAYALLLVDLAVAGQLAGDWATALLGALIVLLGTLAFPAVERRKRRWLSWAYFAVQLPLGVAIFASSVLGSTFLLLVIVGQSVRVLPLWGTLLIGVPLPFLHAGMALPDALRNGGTFLVALIFMIRAERARAALDEANHALRAYATQSEELATARERNRIAREIHDGLGHYLTTIHMQIQAARSILASDRARAEQTLAKAQQLAHEALGDVRRSVRSLRAERQPLPAALAALAQASDDAGLATTLTVLGDARPLDPQEEQALYRAAQEGLTNARKHAQAARATLTLDFSNTKLVRLTVADDGCGATRTDGGFGLIGLRERVQLVGGSLTLQTAPGAGLALSVEVPG